MLEVVDCTHLVSLPSSIAAAANSDVKLSSTPPRFSKPRGTEIMAAISNPQSLTNQAFTAIKKWSPWKSRSLEIPSAVGFGNAHSLARL